MAVTPPFYSRMTTRLFEAEMNTILEMRSITKTFPGVKALSDVNLAVGAWRNSRPCGREWRGQIDANESPERRLSPWQLRR